MLKKGHGWRVLKKAVFTLGLRVKAEAQLSFSKLREREQVEIDVKEAPFHHKETRKRVNTT